MTETARRPKLLRLSDEVKARTDESNAAGAQLIKALRARAHVVQSVFDKVYAKRIDLRQFQETRWAWALLRTPMHLTPTKDGFIVWNEVGDDVSGKAYTVAPMWLPGSDRDIAKLAREIAWRQKRAHELACKLGHARKAALAELDREYRRARDLIDKVDCADGWEITCKAEAKGKWSTRS